MSVKGVMLLAILSLILGSGCGRPAGRPKVTPVNGILTIDGQPLHGISFTLIPVGDTPGVGGMAYSGPDGTFRVIYARGQESGVAPGEYLVRFELEVEEPISEGAKKAIRKPVRITVPQGGGLIELKLTTPAAKPAKPVRKKAAEIEDEF